LLEPLMLRAGAGVLRIPVIADAYAISTARI
jgi:hypothetical protein